MTAWTLTGAAALAAGLLGLATARRVGWDAGLWRLSLPGLLLPWGVQHASLARVSRSASLNPLSASVGGGGLLAGDWVAPALVGGALVACLLRPRRLRFLGALLPVAGSVLVWWVTVPLYAGATMRGWFFLTEGLAGPWLPAWHLSASFFLAGWALSAPAADRISGGAVSASPAPDAPPG